MDHNVKRMFILLKQPGNQYCADCCQDLLLEDNVWCSTSIGVFLCTICAGVHRSFGTSISRIRSVHMDRWNENEVRFIAKNGNHNINKVYERYLPTSLDKPTPASSMEVRKEWIKAKYINKDFMTPFTLNEKMRDLSNRSRAVNLPKRFVDYFGVVGRGSLIDGIDLTSVTDPLQLDFTTEILDRYPLVDYEDSPLQPQIVAFCFPGGVQLSVAPREPVFFTFVLTDSAGIKLYGAALVFYEGLTATELQEIVLSKIGEKERDKLSLPSWMVEPPTPTTPDGDEYSEVYPAWCPKCIFSLSHYQFFRANYEFLTQIYRSSFSLSPVPLERYVCNFTSEIPLPPCGTIQVNIPLIDKYFMISRPPGNQLPHLDISFDLVFGLLSCENIVTIFSLILTEYSVVFVSDHLSLLTPVAESFCSFLFPFWWQGAYIPILPASMVGMVDAPVPLIVGALRDHVSYLLTSKLDDRPPFVTFVDLDKNLIYEASTQERGVPLVTPKLPAHDGSKLIKRLLEIANVYRPGDVGGKASVAFGASNILKPITTFIVQEGVVDKRRAMDTSPEGGNDSMKNKKRSIALSRGKQKSPVGIVSVDGPEIRETFLRFFVSLLRRYKECMVKTTDVTDSRRSGFNDGAFLKLHPESDVPFLTKLLQSQMFARFVEDRIKNPDMNEVKFLDEKIVEKLNRSIAVMKKKGETPFLDSVEMEIKSTYSAPLPDIRDLPRNVIYTFDYFPRLNQTLFGEPRPPRQLFTEMETARAASTKFQQGLNAIAGEDNSYTLNGNFKKTVTVEMAVSGVVKIQALYRMYICRKRFHTSKAAVHYIMQWYRRWRIKNLQRNINARLSTAAVKIQAIVRRNLAKKIAARHLASIIKIQSVIRMRLKRKVVLKAIKSSTTIQSQWRSCRQRRKYLKVQDSVRVAQALVRGFLERRRSLRYRNQKVKEIRSNLALLWERACTSLVIRAKFWVLFKEPYSFLDLAVHIEELNRVNRVLVVAANAATNNPKAGRRASRELAVADVHKKPSSRINATGRLTDVAAHSLAIERHELYNRLKSDVAEGTRSSFYALFTIDEKSKLKKRTLIESLFTTPESMDQSAQVVLATMDNPENRRDWVETLRDQRIKANLLYTSNATLRSFKSLYQKDKERRREHKEMEKTIKDLKKKVSILQLTGGSSNSITSLRDKEREPSLLHVTVFGEKDRLFSGQSLGSGGRHSRGSTTSMVNALLL